MSDLNSWEDDPSVRDDKLAQQAQQDLNINRTQGNSFRGGATSFQPGAQSFQPSGQYPQYGQYGGGAGGGYGQGYMQHGYGYQAGQQSYGQQYNQYGQQNYGNVYSQQYGQYNQSQNTQQPQSQPRQTPVIAKRPGASGTPAVAPNAEPISQNGTPASESKPVVKKEGGVKVLSIGGDLAPKQKESASSDPIVGAASQNKTAPKSEEGSKLVAAKAIEKTEKASEKGLEGATSPAPSSGTSSPTRLEPKPAARKADAVIEEQTADVDEETLDEIYGKEHVNLIFIGHVDAGKSTLGGSILFATGMVDERTMDKYKKEAKEAGRETWYLSWALDLTKEERAKGKTVEVGRGFFETEKRRYSILDAPGHKTFVPNMIGGASQADVGILVISARKGEYETGFEKGGQTREHAMLAKTQGVNKLIVAVNKMDDPTVEWSEARFNECTTKLGAFLKATGYNPKTDLYFMPISAQTTVGIKDRVPKATAPWYDGPSLLEYLDGMKTLERKLNAPFMMPVSAKYKDMGTIIEGKIESGVIKKTTSLLMMPNREDISISAIYGETEEEMPHATCGEQVRLRVRGVEEEDIMPGFVLCSIKRPVHCVKAFEAQIRILELKSILSAGFNCVLHVHSAIEEVTFAALLHKLEKGTGRKSKKPPAFAAKGQSIIARLEVIGGAGSVCVERFEDYPQLGRFTLRDQGQTIAIGKITKLVTENVAS